MIKRTVVTGAFAKGVRGVYGVDIDDIYKKAYKNNVLPASTIILCAGSNDHAACLSFITQTLPPPSTPTFTVICSFSRIGHGDECVHGNGVITRGNRGLKQKKHFTACREESNNQSLVLNSARAVFCVFPSIHTLSCSVAAFRVSQNQFVIHQ